jgi:hypothetical protein
MNESSSGKMHKYQLGQRVRYTANVRGQLGATRFTITRLLPRVGNNLSYRVKALDEPHERTVEEESLEPLF